MTHLFHSISNMINGITGGNVFAKLAVYCGAAVTAYFTPIVGLLLTCFACTIVDMIYGIKVAKKFNQKITSNKNWKGTLLKIRDEFTIIGLTRLIEMTTLGAEGVFVLTGGATIIIAMTELWSILENLNTLNPDGPWKSLSKFLKNKGEQYTGIEVNLSKDGNIDDIKVVEEPLENRL